MNTLCSCGNKKTAGSAQCRSCFLIGVTASPTKVCTACKEDKPWSEYRLRTRKTSEPRPRPTCKACEAATFRERIATTDSTARNLSHKEWRLKNPDAYARIALRRLAKSYGLDPDVIEQHFKDHSGLCDVCGKPPAKTSRGSRLYIDHCHTSGKFRGLLCSTCNTGLGMFKDSPELLAKAIEYLST